MANGCFQPKYSKQFMAPFIINNDKQAFLSIKVPALKCNPNEANVSVVGQKQT